MARSNARLRRLALVLGLAAAGLFSMACVTVHLVGDYDPQVDQAATRMQKQMDSFLTHLESLPAGAEARHYQENREFYLDYGVDLRSLETRAAGTPKNSITVQQVQLMESSVEELRKTHEEQDDVSNPALDQYRTLFNTAWQAILAFELAKKSR